MTQAISHTQPSAITKQVTSISYALTHIQNTLHGTYPVLYIKGEICELTQAKSGHFYFTLKDTHSQLSCVMLKQHAVQLAHLELLKNGIHIVIKTQLNLYKPRGQFQAQVLNFKAQGQGLLREQFLAIRNKCLKEALFCASHKKKLPTFPKRIAVISSLEAAGLQDFLNILYRRNRLAEILVFPTLVQGPHASAMIKKAYLQAQHHPYVDLIVLCRGGGSKEDLWCFNDEALIRAIYACPIPTLSGIGHEQDYTLCDEVADVRAATPTAAAVTACVDGHLLRRKIESFTASIHNSIWRLFDKKHHIKTIMHQKLMQLHPLHILQQQQHQRASMHQTLSHHANLRMQRLITQHQRLQQRLSACLITMQHSIHARKQRVHQHTHTLPLLLHETLRVAKRRIDQHRQLIHALHPKHTLNRGYAMLQTQGTFVSSVQDIASQDVNIYLKDGMVKARVIDIIKKPLHPSTNP